MMHRLLPITAALTLCAAPPALAQTRPLPDSGPPRTAEWGLAGAQVKQLPARGPRAPVAAQFDSLGLMPLGIVGDTVTLFLFDNGATLSRARRAVITSRQRFTPPLSWRAACDEKAHPGWRFGLNAPATSAFAVVVPGAYGMPEHRAAPRLARNGGFSSYKAWADSAFARYKDAIKPKTERAAGFLYFSFYSDSLDAGYRRKQFFGVRGPGGYNLTVYSAWLRDDYADGTPNTTGTWIIDGWGIPIARTSGNVDIYGTVDADHDGIDEIVTSSGLIRWDGQQWRFPPVYADEPCLFHKVMAPPPGVRP
ncbi:MAG: hypothetical protein ABJC19_02250 [Gemmatimonadota bacterium]